MLNGKAGYLFNVGDIKQLENKICYVTNKKNYNLIKNKIRLGYTSMRRFDYLKNMNLYLKEVRKFL